jgi:hypothetical protein
MAEVKMDLNELKALEAKLAALEVEKADLIDKQKMVVVLHKYFTGTIKQGRNSNGGVRVTGIRTVIDERRGASRMYHERSYGDPLRMPEYRDESFDQTFTITGAIREGLIDIELKEDTSRLSRDYLNLSEVAAELKEIEESKVKDQLQKAYDRATSAEFELAAIDDKHVKRLRTFTEGYQNDILKLNKDHDVEIEKLIENNEAVLKVTIQEWTDRHEILQDKFDTLEEDYELLKSDKKRESLENKVLELQKKMQELLARGFWDRLFNR